MSQVSSTNLSPLPSPEAAWDEAFLRVESYLRAHHLESRVLLNKLATDIIREAQATGGQNPGDEPVVLAMRVTHARIGAWFSLSSKEADWSNERVRARGRLAMLLSNLAARWPNSFLSGPPVEPELSAALGSGRLMSGPELRLSNMPPAPLEFGFDDYGDPRLPKKDAGLFLRAAVPWVLLVGLFGVAWAASH